MGDQTHSTGALDAAPDSYISLAEENGALLQQNMHGHWAAFGPDGDAVVRDAMSKAEAARLYVEEMGLGEEGGAA